MSNRLFPEDILFEQRLLSCAGFYAGKLDGSYGTLTQAAEDKAFAAYIDIQKSGGTFDARSEKNIATLLPAMQRKARDIMRAAASRQGASGLRVVVLSGTRTYAEQNKLYAQRPKVTNAHGGQSNHNFGIAIDIGLFLDGRYLTGDNRAEEKMYADFAKATKAAVSGIEWGGDWHSFPDMPHYQLATGRSLKEVRTAFEKGLPYS